EPLADGIAGMPHGPGVQRGDLLLRHVWRHVERTETRHEARVVIMLVAAERRPTAARNLLRHGPGGLPLRPAGGAGEAAVHRQAVTILDQHVPEVAELRLVSLGLLEQERVRVGNRRVRGVAALLRVEVDSGIAGSSGGGGVVPLRTKLFCPAHAWMSVPSTEK